MTILEQILATKRAEVALLNDSHSRGDLVRRAEAAPKPLEWLESLRGRQPLGLIAEVKKASPSKGVIDPDFQPVETAVAYEKAGANALSVLTDRTYFQGSSDILTSVRENVHLPVLRKDFLIDEAQIYESRAIGADAVLLIAAALPMNQLRVLYSLARELGMDVLLEVHTVAEWEQVAPLQPAVVGVNNRDLLSFAVDLRTTEEVAARVGQQTFLVSESGIRTHADIARVRAAGAKAVLVGETLMRMGRSRVIEGVRELLYAGG